jgi:RimJ/RimL family protein N-acetyltransferase
VRNGLHPGRMGPDALAASLLAARFAAFNRADEQLVGMFRIDGRQLSYAVASALWGQGLGSEIVMAVCAQVAPALRMRRLDAHVERDNVRSRRLLESCGFALAPAWSQNEWQQSSVLVYHRRIADPAP